MFCLVGVLLSLGVLIVSLLWFSDYFQRRKVYNLKTGEVIQGNSIFFTPWFLLTQKNVSAVHLTQKLHRKLGKPLTNIFSPFKLIVIVRDAILAKQVLNDTETYHHYLLNVVKYTSEFIGHDNLVAVNGTDWKRQRKVLDPAFKSIGKYFDIFSKKTAEVMNQMIEKDGPIVDDVHKYTQTMALDILGLAIFGYDFKSTSMKENEELTSYNYLMGIFFDFKKALPAIFTHHFDSLSTTQETLKQLKIWKDFKASLVEISKNNIKEKKIKSEDYSLLDLMVESWLENEDEDKISQIEILDNVAVLFLAGHETTASALAFGIQILAKYPEIQKKLRKEIFENIEKVDTESIEKLPYLMMFIKELLRMYPPIASIPAKITTKNTTLGDYFLPKGTIIRVSALDIHTNEEYYENPDKFIPERWDKNTQKKIPHYAWIPFSSGSRVCIGNNFSLMEQKIFFTELLMNYEVIMTNPHEIVDVAPSSGLFQSPTKIQVEFKKLKK
eukprot:gene2712-3908_t